VGRPALEHCQAHDGRGYVVTTEGSNERSGGSASRSGDGTISVRPMPRASSPCNGVGPTATRPQRPGEPAVQPCRKTKSIRSARSELPQTMGQDVREPGATLEWRADDY